MIRGNSSLSRPGKPAFQKIILSIETMAELDIREDGRLIEKWKAAYSWLINQDKAAFKINAQFVNKLPKNDFQD